MKLEKFIETLTKQGWQKRSNNCHHIISPTVRTLGEIRNAATCYIKSLACTLTEEGIDTRQTRLVTLRIKGEILHEQCHAATFHDFSTSGCKVHFRIRDGEDYNPMISIGVAPNKPITTSLEEAICACAPEASCPYDKMSPADKKTFENFLDDLQKQYPHQERAQLEQRVKKEARRRVETVFRREGIKL